MNFDLALDCNSYSIFSPTEYIDRTKIVNLKGELIPSVLKIYKNGADGSLGEITSGWDITSTVTGCQNAVKSVKYQFTYKNL